MKQSNVLARRNENNATMDQISLYRMAIASDEKMVDVLLKGKEDYGALSPNEKERFDTMLGQQFWNTAQLWDRVQVGLLEEEMWSKMTGPRAADQLEGGCLDWWEQNNGRFPQAFIESIELFRQRRPGNLTSS